MRRKLLIMRPEPGNSKTATSAREAGLDALPYPLFAVAGLPWVAPDPRAFDALLFTSANAVRHGGDQLALYRDRPAFAVGGATAQAIRDAGFLHVIEGRAGVDSIVHAIVEQGHRKILHLAGAQVRRFDAGRLQLTRVAVYEASPIGEAAGLGALMTPGTVVLVHSPRAGRRLATLVGEGRRKDIAIVAISAEALEACGRHWGVGLAAPTPDDKALLALAAQLCL